MEDLLGHVAGKRSAGESGNDPITALGKRKGSYILHLALDGAISIQVGRLGRFDFAAGVYAYVGSAFGPGGLRSRLRRHLKARKPRRWHVDYLRAHAAIAAIWYGPDPREHDWAALLQGIKGAAIPVPGFGASDCSCPAHLFYLHQPLEPDLFQERIRQRFPKDGRITVLELQPGFSRSRTGEKTGERGSNRNWQAVK